MTLQEMYNARYGGQLHDRIGAAVAIAALSVLTESDTTPNHANRMLWVKATLEKTATIVDTMIWGVLLQPNFQTDATDEQIISAVESLVNTAALLVV
jgi:hypothetical protein